MEEYNRITHQIVSFFVKKRMRREPDLKLLEREVKRIFVEDPVVVISKIKEEELIRKLKRAFYLKECYNLIFIISVVLSVTVLFFIWR